MLLVEDDVAIQRLLVFLLEDEGGRVFAASTGEEGLDLLAREPFDLVLTDLYLPGVDGLEVLRRSRALDPDVPVLMLTAHSSVQTAVEAIRSGAHDYLEKPIDHDRLRQVYRGALDLRALRLKAQLFDAPQGSAAYHGIVGRCDAMRWLFQMVERVARFDTPVLVTGESGTGKELVAAALHTASKRVDAPFVAVNCASVVESLFESTFFGHLKGSFTGANRDKKGLFEAAHGGTLFLDEIGEMDPGLQARLLRVLETREITPVGSNRSRKVDVRIVAATNADLVDAIEQGTFRRDLYYRICGVHLELPALRDRGDDIRLLAERFLTSVRKDEAISVLGYAPEVWPVLMAYPWPGNVRELRRVVESSAVMSMGNLVDLASLPPMLRRFASGMEAPAAEPAYIAPTPPPTTASPAPEPAAEAPPAERPMPAVPASAPAPAPSAVPPRPGGPPLTLEEAEAKHVREVLERAGGSRKKAADWLGISRHAVYRLLKKHGLE